MFSGVLLLGVLVGAALLGHQRSGKRARARKLARLNGVKVLMMRRTEERIEEGNLDFCDCNRSCKVLPEPVVGGAEETQPTMVQRAGVHEEVVNIIISLIIIVVINIVIIIVVNIIIVIITVINIIISLIIIVVISIVIIVNLLVENI